MIVVADAGPLQDLIRIGAVDVLPALYERVLVLLAITMELQQQRTPVIHPDPPSNPTLAFLDRGERAAILPALSVRAGRLLIDDADGRSEATRRHLAVTGTLGVRAVAHVIGLLDFEPMLARLCQTNFYVTDDVVARVRRQLAIAGRNA